MAMTPVLHQHVYCRADLGRALGAATSNRQVQGDARYLRPVRFSISFTACWALASVSARRDNVGLAPEPRSRLEAEARVRAPVMSTVRPASRPGAARTSSVLPRPVSWLVQPCRAVDKNYPVVWRSTPSTRSISYAVDDATIVVWPSTPSTASSPAASTKTARNSKAHATLAKHRQRRPQLTPAAASPPMLRRVTAWGVRMLLQARGAVRRVRTAASLSGCKRRAVEEFWRPGVRPVTRRAALWHAATTIEMQTEAAVVRDIALRDVRR